MSSEACGFEGCTCPDPHPWSVGDSVRIGPGNSPVVTITEVIPTYRVQLPDGGWMIVEAAQIRPLVQQT